jgi:hypothetical protein
LPTQSERGVHASFGMRRSRSDLRRCAVGARDATVWRDIVSSTGATRNMDGRPAARLRERK